VTCPTSQIINCAVSHCTYYATPILVYSNFAVAMMRFCRFQFFRQAGVEKNALFFLLEWNDWFTRALFF